MTTIAVLVFLTAPPQILQSLPAEVICKAPPSEVRRSEFVIVVLPMFTFVSEDFTPRVRPPAKPTSDRNSLFVGWTSGFT